LIETGGVLTLPIAGTPWFRHMITRAGILHGYGRQNHPACASDRAEALAGSDQANPTRRQYSDQEADLIDQRRRI